MKNLLKKNKKGNILTENIIFIVLNLAFITILLLFLFSRTGDASVLEEKYAKQISMLIDAAEPVTTIHLNMEDAVEIAEKENFPAGEIVTRTGNVITVKLREDGGYSYSFFNDVDVNANFDTINKKEYYFVISEKE
ncbi:MAG: hypothetical protein Q8P79_00930 [Nanoarchaeota archaeon]|nr:hypothetical protein [Nanoarchaeota archaeon]